MKSLHVIMPVYNEVAALPIVVEEWASMLTSLSINYQFIICEDGSIDGTKELLTTLQKKYPIIASQTDTRRGYGKAMLAGIKLANAEYVACLDADGQCNPQDFIKFWQARDRKVILLGERKPRRDTKLRKVYSFLFHLFFKMLYQDHIKDPSSCFMLAPSKVLKNLSRQIAFAEESFRWGVCAAALKNNIKIKEIRINHRKRLSGRTRVFTISNTPGIVFRGMKGMIQIKLSVNSK